MSGLIKDEFWSDRIKTVTKKTLPSMHNVLRKTGRWDFFDFNYKGEGKDKPHIFWDSDMAKFLEAVCFALKYTDISSPEYTQYVEWIEQITSMALKAAQPDGYLNSYFTQLQPEERFKNISEKHELYCCGHLIEAAVAHHEATGSMELVNCLCKYLDLICKTFGKEDGKLHGYPGHPEIELAIVKLLKIVPEPRYFEILDYFIEQRGYNNGEFYDDQFRARGIDPVTYLPPGDPNYTPDGENGSMWPSPRSYWYFQAEDLIRNCKEVKGHSVRVVYLLTAVQSLARLKNDDDLRKTVQTLFENMVDKKMYIHGGIGAIGRWEGFGENYDLRWDGYSETCASIGLIFLCRQILEDNLNRKTAIAMEKALYNDVLGGVSIEGDSYFYDQPITGEAGLKRQSWFDVACCPPNVARLFNSLEKYSFMENDEYLSIFLYIGFEVETENYKATASTKYPFEGVLNISIKSKVSISVRIREPSYSYTCSHSNYSIQNGFLIFSPKIWENEIITVSFDVPVVIIKPNPKVKANVGHLAIQRGPFVYALQRSGVSKDVSLNDISVSSDQAFNQVRKKFGNLEYISLVTESNGLVLEFVPYFVTGNEHPGEDFRIWIKHKKLTKLSKWLSCIS